MKQLTKEQHEAIYQWMKKKEVELLRHNAIMSASHLYKKISDYFTDAFPPSCCDSCADGDTCESEQKETSQLVKLKKLDEFFRRIK